MFRYKWRPVKDLQHRSILVHWASGMSRQTVKVLLPSGYCSGRNSAGNNVRGGFGCIGSSDRGSW